MCMSLMNQIDYCIANIHPYAILSQMNFLAHEVHIENSMLRNRGLLGVLFFPGQELVEAPTVDHQISSVSLWKGL